MWRDGIAIVLVLLVVYIATAGGHLYSPDEETMFRVTESIATRGRLDIEPIMEGPDRGFAARLGTHRRFYAQYGLGNSLLAVPFYYAGSLACRFVSNEKAVRTLDFRTTIYYDGPNRGHALLKRFAVSFFGIVVAALTGALLYFLVHYITHSRWAGWLTALAYGLGTMAWPHGRTFFSEPLATFFVLASFYLVAAGRMRPGRAFAAGLVFALALLTRLDSIVVLPGAVLLMMLRYVEMHQGVGVLGTSVREVRRQLLDRRFIVLLVLAAFPVVMFLVFYLLMNRLHFGGAFSSAYASRPEGIRFSTPLHAGLYGYFGSIGKSIFLFSPAVVIGLLAWPAFWKRQAPLAIASITAILALLLFHARWQNWTGGWCWGPRHIFMVHMFAILPVAEWVRERTRAKMWFYGIIMALAVVVQMYGCSQSFIDFYILYYRTPDKPPQAYVLFSPEDVTAPLRAQAPINDSIYVPQNSQWYRYAEMWEIGYTDNLWARLRRRALGTENEI